MSAGLRFVAMCTLVGLLTAGTTTLAGPVAADVEGRSEHDLGPLRVSRHQEQFSVSACLIGFEGRGTPLEEVENTLRLLVDGEPALSQDQVIEFDLPAIDGTPDPDDPCTGSMHHFGVWLPMSAVADAGVAMPALGEWTSFELTAVLEIEDPESGHLELESERTVDIGAGDPIGEFTSATPTPDGVRLGGWIVDPEHAVSVRYRVTVNGRDTAVDEVEPDMVAGQLAGELADGPGPSIWEERELGDAHAIDALVPYGEICVYVLLDEAAPIDEGFVGLGCRTTMSGEVRGGIDSATPRSDGARITAHLINPWIDSDEAFPGAWLVPDKGRPLQITEARRRSGLPATYGEVTGWFDFTVDMPLPPGRRTICLEEQGEHSPSWWWKWAESPYEDDVLGCTTVQVPHMPIGAAQVIVNRRRVTVTGWAIDLNGGSPLVLVSVNGKLRASTRTNEPNEDVRRTYGGDGRAGFTVRFDLPRGKHRVCTAWQDTSGGGWSAATCEDVVVK